MTVSYSPALEVSDSPATDPSERAFCGGGGAAPAFDIDSIFTASRTGDFFVSNTNIYEDAGSTDAADTAGDLVYTWTGGRTAGTNRTMVQATAGYRPELSSDGTHGLVVYGLGAAIKLLRDTSWSMNSATNGHTWGMRVRRSARPGGGSSGAGFALGQDFNPFQDGIGEVYDGSDFRWRVGGSASDSVSHVDESTSWLTVLGTIDTSKNAALYIDDSSAAVDSATLVGHATSSRHNLGHLANDPCDYYVYKFFSIDEVVSDIAGCMSWLEA